MGAAPHLVVGAARTMRARNPLIAFGVGLISHAVLDAIPHYHLARVAGLSRLSLIDAALRTCLALMIVAAAPAPRAGLLGTVGGIFPEIERMVSGQRHDFLERASFGLPHAEIGLLGGVTQIVITITTLVVAVQFHRCRKS